MVIIKLRTERKVSIFCVRFDQERLCLFIGQRSPDPFRRTESEITQPYRRNYQLYNPDAEHEENLVPPGNLAEQRQALAVKDKSTDYRLGQIIGECSSAHRCQGFLQESQNISFRKEHDE